MRSRFGCSSTLLDKLWYIYSYIYKATTTAYALFHIFALLFLVLILMPTPSTSLLPGIVSLSPYPLSRTRSFTMSNFTAITHLNFEFGPHHSQKYEFLYDALNNVYSEPLYSQKRMFWKRFVDRGP